MLLKTADDKSARVKQLEALVQSPRLDMGQRAWAKKELGRLLKGIQGERESAYYLERRYVDSSTHVLLHDLRLDIDGEVAQIDHLLINRGGAFYLIETKNYAGNLVISEHGEFSVEYGEDRFGIPSPIEQGKRHEAVLRKALDCLGLGARALQTDVFHLVMVHPKATIQRPDAKAFDTSNIIKADQFDSWHQKFVEKLGTLTVLKSMANARTLETLKEWGEKLIAEHKPANLLQLPDFIEKSLGPVLQTEPTAGQVFQSPPKSSLQQSPAPAPEANAVSEQPEPRVSAVRPSTGFALPGEKKLVCNHCGNKISFPEGKFCWAYPERFGGTQYCREHQGFFR
ncbi:MAG TPA: nuclease-related domain-containing protein [Burkholderiaceae bacterium]|nr:nuclease-related domain-containing protein [Burkholderiaceae bacterium]